MAQINQVCDTCNARINTEFAPGTGARTEVIIDHDVITPERCFVADTIIFLDKGRLIFAPPDGVKTYFPTYNVVCRKLIIKGGGAPQQLQPCEPVNPGKDYDGKNVITWQGRLTSAPLGSADPGGPAANGESFDTDNWADRGQGNNGMNGGRGVDGAAGKPQPGDPGPPLNRGDSAPAGLNIVALEVEIGATDHLIVDWYGQNGGDGGRGQDGGDGGRGMGGRDGEVDESWTGDSCGRQPGNGGNGGDGGNGGPGGIGGPGGNGGTISVVTPMENMILGGAFLGGNIAFVYSGPNGGKGGRGGHGGRAATQFGKPGKKTSECDPADPGVPGNNGNPKSLPPEPTVDGANGDSGNPGALKFEAIAPPASSTCADIIPVIPVVTGLSPNSGLPDTLFAVTITGSGFDPAASQHQVTVSGSGVSVLNVVAVDDATITCTFNVSNLASPGARGVTVKVGAYQGTLAGGFTVSAPVPLTVTAIAPNTGARGAVLAGVTITGTAFNPASPLHLVNVSGAGVAVSSVSAVSNTTITCTFTIGPLAPLGARDVTVTVGAQNVTLAGGFTVTA